MNLLLIDDDIDDADLFREALEEIAPAVAFHTCQDGRKAIEKLRSSALSPDIIFLDLNMPMISGWECLRTIQQSPELMNIPVVIYTTSSHAADKERALEAGAVQFLTKPDNFRMLKDYITDILTDWQKGRLAR